MNTYDYLYEIAQNTKVIDTHEHLQCDKSFIGKKPDILTDYFSHYITTDLMSSGMNGYSLCEVSNPDIDIEKRWKLLEPHIEYVQNTAYYRSLQIAMDRLYGISDMTKDTVGTLNEKFIQNASKPDYRHYIMKEICNIDRSVNDDWSDDVKKSTNDLFVTVWHPTAYVLPDIKPNKDTLEAWCEEYKEIFFKKKTDGIAALKLATAYDRSLYFEDVDYKTASKLYHDYIKSLSQGENTEDEASLFPKPIQDYIMHYILKLANEHHMVVQIHTGLQEGMGNNLHNSDPMKLRNLFTKYPDITFDIFHMGYPYERELMVLAKTHHNVFIDLCWANIISPYATRNALYEMLEVVPYNKIFGFGGDYLFYDGVVGHVTLARQNICKVLAQKVDKHEMTLSLAEKILVALLRTNAKKVFSL